MLPKSFAFSGLPSVPESDVVLRDIPAKYDQLLHHATSLKALWSLPARYRGTTFQPQMYCPLKVICHGSQWLHRIRDMTQEWTKTADRAAQPDLLLEAAFFTPSQLENFATVVIGA
jgi:hypothetical protein